ncbi:MAG: hypothetical protein CMI16_07580 [Opitutaceae bacterium]|nr:hypothetical protein [Opitutaceae bacterium]
MPLPIIQFEAQVTYDILSPDRVHGFVSIYGDHVNMDLRSDEGASSKFDLYNLASQILPNLDTLIVIGSRADPASNIYVFLSCMRARDNCLSTMRLLGYCVLDGYGNRIGTRRITASNSLPAMSTILEDL